MAGPPSGQKVFAEMTNDTTSDEWDALARKQHPTQGRWVSPDPSGLSAVDPTNPQTWNRYAYVANSPLDTIDPSGLSCQPVAAFAGGGCDTSGGEPFDPNIYASTTAFYQFVYEEDSWANAMWQARTIGPGPSMSNSILPGENSLNFPLGPSPAQILNDILTGNFGDLLGINENNCNPICDSGTDPNNASNDGQPSPQAVRQSMLQILWKPALGTLCSSINSWSGEDAEHAKQDSLIGGLAVTVAPPVSVVMLGTAGVYEIASKVEEETYNAICQ